MTLTTSQLRAEWGPNCATNGQLKRSPFLATWVTMHVLVIDHHALDALAYTMTMHGYRVDGPDTGAMNCRQITGGTGLSLHAFGIAIDVEWQSNPYGTKLVTNMSRAMIDDILAIRTVSGHQVWRWGGDWDGNPATPHAHYDAMHFEICCTKAQLASGIRGFNFDPIPDPVDPAKEDDMFTDADRDHLDAITKKLDAMEKGAGDFRNELFARIDSAVADRIVKIRDDILIPFINYVRSKLGE